MAFKKYALAMLVAASSAAALAQNTPTSNVEVFGRLDIGVISANNVGTARQTLTHITSSPVGTSFIGFRGLENLGGGNSAGFLIESQINPADGTQGVSSGAGAANGVFAREANVFLRNKDLGTLRLGRQVQPIYQYFNQQDVRGGIGFGSSLVYFADGSSFGGTATAKTGVGTITGSTYGSNIASWQSPNWNGVTVRAMYGFGNTVDNMDYGQRLGVGALYDQGPYVLTAGYYQGKSSTGAINAEYQFLGGGYRITDSWIVRSGYTQFKNPSIAGSANSEFDLKQISTAYDIDKAHRVFVGYYNFNDMITTANKSNMISTGIEKKLSNRTMIYAVAAQQDNNGTAGFAAYGGGGANMNSLNTAQFPSTVQSSANQMVYGVGMLHTF
jgi:predicted porin